MLGKVLKVLPAVWHFVPKLRSAFGLMGIIGDVNEACMLLGEAVQSLKKFVHGLSADLRARTAEIFQKFDLAFEKFADICKKLRLHGAEAFLRDIISP